MHILRRSKEVTRHPCCYVRHQQITDRSLYDALWQGRSSAANDAALERGFLNACGQVLVSSRWTT